MLPLHESIKLWFEQKRRKINANLQYHLSLILSGLFLMQVWWHLSRQEVAAEHFLPEYLLWPPETKLLIVNAYTIGVKRVEQSKLIDHFKSELQARLSHRVLLIVPRVSHKQLAPKLASNAPPHSALCSYKCPPPLPEMWIQRPQKRPR